MRKLLYFILFFLFFPPTRKLLEILTKIKVAVLNIYIQEQNCLLL